METAQRTKRPVFVPASIQRLRCYLNTRAGMKVKPWAGVEDTLDAFYDALASQKKEGDFWQGLEALLTALTGDMDRRAEAGGRGVIPNELLDAGARAGLLDEIRGKLDGAGRGMGRGRFRRLASTLSAPALGLALILGSVATVGCYDSSNRHDDADTSTDPAVEADGADTAPDPVPDPLPDPLPDPGPDPDLLPDPVVDPVVDPACDSGLRTLEEILAGCPLPEDERLYYLECIDALHASWRTGLTELFACESCDDVLWQLRDCLSGRCYNPEGQGPFDLEDFLDNCAVVFYLGVRFE